MTQDTIRLLRECDAGVKMGISSFEDVLGHVQNRILKNLMETCKAEHEKLHEEIQSLLSRHGEEGKEIHPMAKGMSHIKTNMKLAMEGNDGTVADMIIDGCNMGVKSLSRYLNQYKAASPEVRAMAKRLIRLEEDLATDIRPFL